MHWRSVSRLFQVCGTSAILQVCGEVSVFGRLACGEALWGGLTALWLLWRGSLGVSLHLLGRLVARLLSLVFGLWRGSLGGSLHPLGLVARLPSSIFQVLW